MIIIVNVYSIVSYLVAEMSCIKLCMFITTLVLFTCTVNGKNFSIVTLSHGGQVRGLRTSFQDVLVNSFLGKSFANK